MYIYILQYKINTCVIRKAMCIYLYISMFIYTCIYTCVYIKYNIYMKKFQSIFPQDFTVGQRSVSQAK